jgi:hypothetical protein
MADATSEAPGPITTMTHIAAIRMRMERTFKQAQADPPTNPDRLAKMIAELRQLRTEAMGLDADARRVDPKGERHILSALTELLADMDANGKAYLNIYLFAIQKDIEAKAYKDNLNAQELAIRQSVIAKQKKAFEETQIDWTNATFHRCPICQGWNYGEWCPHCSGYRR